MTCSWVFAAFLGVTAGAATGVLTSVPNRRNPRELAAFLAGIPLFASLDETARLQLAGRIELMHVAAGEVIISEGETGEGPFVVVSGRLRVPGPGRDHGVVRLPPPPVTPRRRSSDRAG